MQNGLVKQVTDNIGYYPTLSRKTEELKEIVKEDKNKVTFLQRISGN